MSAGNPFDDVDTLEDRWRQTRLEDCIFESCDLMRMQPRKLALRGVTFIRCRLTGIDWTDIAPNPSVTFEECNLQYSSFVKVNLAGTTFRSCRAIEVNFIDARLQEAEFAQSDLSGSTFEGCDLQKAGFATSVGFLADPRKNRVKGARINASTASLLASSFGFQVD